MTDRQPAELEPEYSEHRKRIVGESPIMYRGGYMNIHHTKVDEAAVQLALRDREIAQLRNFRKEAAEGMGLSEEDRDHALLYQITNLKRATALWLKYSDSEVVEDLDNVQPFVPREELKAEIARLKAHIVETSELTDKELDGLPAMLELASERDTALARAKEAEAEAARLHNLCLAWERAADCITSNEHTPAALERHGARLRDNWDSSTKLVFALESENERLRTALELAQVDLSAGHSWCRICHTKNKRPATRRSHVHAASCPLFIEAPADPGT